MFNYRTLLGALAFLSEATMATAQDAAPVEELTAEEAEQAYLDWAEEVLADIEAEQGTIELSKAPIIITLPDTLEFYDAKETRTILEDLWGNPEDDTPLGMIFPVGQNPVEAPWGALLTYEDTGYVSDTDAHDIDFDELLAEMKSDITAENSEREKQGYATLELFGWAEAPNYDAENHRVSWAKDLLFSTSGDDHTLNYDMRILGRHGVLSINFVADMSALEDVKAAAPAVLAAPRFKEGTTYADYQEGDKKSGYGVAALIAGGAGVAAAKKLGFLGITLLILKKGWIVIIAGMGLLGKRFSGLFGGRDKD